MARGRGPLRWLQRHSRRIEIVGGVLLVGMGVAMMTGGWTVLMSRMRSRWVAISGCWAMMWGSFDSSEAKLPNNL